MRFVLNKYLFPVKISQLVYETIAIKTKISININLIANIRIHRYLQSFLTVHLKIDIPSENKIRFQIF